MKKDELRVLFVELLEEGTTAFRPIIARQLTGEAFQILELPEYRDLDEDWSCKPGEKVRIKVHEISDGSTIDLAERIG